jgi:folylpolyglutamate synthase/dihydropteroate synthase
VVAQAFADAGASTRTAPSVVTSLEEALDEAEDADLICVTGSLYVVSEARAWLLGILPDELSVTAPAATQGERPG